MNYQHNSLNFDIFIATSCKQIAFYLLLFFLVKQQMAAMEDPEKIEENPAFYDG